MVWDLPMDPVRLKVDLHVCVCQIVREWEREMAEESEIFNYTCSLLGSVLLSWLCERVPPVPRGPQHLCWLTVRLNTLAFYFCKLSLLRFICFRLFYYCSPVVHITFKLYDG